ncbi:hypothetical protein PSHT_01370, partial [Puccinia striiformis]
MAELAATYAALILADDGLEITADKITTLLTTAKVEIEPIWATLLAKALEGKDVKDMLSNVGAGGGAAAPAAAVAAASGGEAAAPKAEEKKVEEKEESDDDMGFGLFDYPFTSPRTVIRTVLGLLHSHNRPVHISLDNEHIWLETVWTTPLPEETITLKGDGSHDIWSNHGSAGSFTTDAL